MKPQDTAPYLFSLSLRRDRVPGYEEYPFNLPAVKALDSLEFHERVTFLVGDNGTGKSTLLEALAITLGLNPEGGSHNFDFATRPSHSEDLFKYIGLKKSPILPRDQYFLRAESFYNVATEIERLGVQEYYGGKSLHDQSHGESFFTLFEKRFRAGGLYLLDEPEAALSPNRQLSFLTLLHDYCNTGSQFVIATHSPIIMAYPHAWIYVLGDGPIRKVAYEETEHYKITRAFMSHPKKMLKVLLEEEQDSDK